MKIATDNGPIRNVVGDLRALELIAEAGFDGVDFTMYKLNPEDDILALDAVQRSRRAAQLRTRAAELGLTFPQSHATYAYQPWESKDSKNYQDVLRCLEFAAELGCPQMVIHSLKFPVEDRTTDRLARNREYYWSLLPYAEQFGVDIGIENLFVLDKKRQRFFKQMSTPEEMNAFVDSLGSERFKVCCDVGHAAITGVEPQDFILGMDNRRMTMVHIQDTDYRSDTHAVPYMGQQDWDAITRALAQVDFQGPMSLELTYYYAFFPEDMMGAAVQLAASAARRLAGMVERYRAGKMQ